MEVGTAKQLGNELRALRRRRRLTQLQLADAAGISRQYLVGLEAGTVNATWDVVTRVVAALEADVTLVDRKDGSRQVAAATADAVVNVGLDQLLDAHRDSDPLAAGRLRLKWTGR